MTETGRCAMRVAIVDDDPIVCSSLSTILMQGGGVEVIWTAYDGANAVDSYRRMPPDVLLMDVQMSGGNGLDAARSIIGEDDGARILFLTTFADKSYIEQALSIGGKGISSSRMCLPCFPPCRLSWRDRSFLVRRRFPSCRSKASAHQHPGIMRSPDGCRR